MTAVAFGLGCLAAVAIIALVMLTLRTRVISSRTRERVIVTTKTGETFTGVLYSHDRDALVLRQSEALGAGENQANLPLDGELIVLLPDVSFIQRP